VLEPILLSVNFVTCDETRVTYIPVNVEEILNIGEVMGGWSAGVVLTTFDITH